MDELEVEAQLTLKLAFFPLYFTKKFQRRPECADRL